MGCRVRQLTPLSCPPEPSARPVTLAVMTITVGWVGLSILAALFFKWIVDFGKALKSIEYVSNALMTPSATSSFGMADTFPVLVLCCPPLDCGECFFRSPYL